MNFLNPQRKISNIALYGRINLMKYKWLNKKNNKKVILFFNGWGMDDSVVKHLNPEDYDVIMYYDYNSLDADFSPVENYFEKYCI